MNDITRFEPFLSRFDPFRDMDAVFSKLMMHPFSGGEMKIEPQIKMDVQEANGQYLVNAEIPGANKDDIHVTIDGNRVSIRAEVKQETAEQGTSQV